MDHILAVIIRSTGMARRQHKQSFFAEDMTVNEIRDARRGRSRSRTAKQLSEDRQRRGAGPRRRGRPASTCSASPAGRSGQFFPVEADACPSRSRPCSANPKTGVHPDRGVERYDGDREYVHGSLLLTVERVPLSPRPSGTTSTGCGRSSSRRRLTASRPATARRCSPTSRSSSGSTGSASRSGSGCRSRDRERTRTAVTSARTTTRALADAGLRFFEHLERLVPRSAEADRDKVAACGDGG